MSDKPSAIRVADLAQRVARLHARLETLAGVASIDGGDKLLADARHAAQVSVHLCDLLQRGTSEAKLDDEESAKLQQLLWQRLREVAAGFGPVDVDALMVQAFAHVTAGLPLLEECVDMLENQRDAEQSLHASLAEHSATLAQVHAILDRLEEMPASPGLQHTLEQVLGTAHAFQIDTDLPALQDARRQAESLHRRAVDLLQRTRKALGELPD